VLLTPAPATTKRGYSLPLKQHKIAVIPGDGVGPEVIAEGRRVLNRAASLCDFEIAWSELPWGSDYYRRHGTMMPADAFDVVREHEAVYFGAVGSPDVPDDVTVWGLVLALRKELDLYVNLRPVKLFPGVPTPVKATPEQIDFVFVRENTEGEYSRLGGRFRPGMPEETAVENSLFTRRGIERIARYAFELARTRNALMTSVTKSNALTHGMVLWDEVVARVARDYPDVRWERMLVDACAYRMVREPGRFGVLVGSNLFGDILTDLGAALQGSLGLAASANINPEANEPGLFEPVHGSAPDIAGKGIANPIGAIWSGALMLRHLGEQKAADAVDAAVASALAAGAHTPDLGGTATTKDVGAAVLSYLSQNLVKGT